MAANEVDIKINEGSGTNLDGVTVTTGNGTLRRREVVSVGDDTTGANRWRINASNEGLVNSADGSLVTLGAKADAGATNTDTTAVSVIALLKGHFLRLIVGTSDAVARSGIGMLLHAGVNPAGTVDALKTLDSANYGKGVLLTSGVADPVSSGVLAYGSITSFVAIIAARPSIGVKRRALALWNNTDVAVAFQLRVSALASGGLGFFTMVTITCPAAALCYVTSQGIINAAGSSTATFGAVGHLDDPAGSVAVWAQQTGGGAGGVTAELVQIT